MNENANALEITHKLTIKSNMDALAEKIKKDIDEKYNLVVTEDTVADTKKLMAQINKEKDEFKSTYKAFKDELTAPLKPLDAKAKEIEGYFSEARNTLEVQVKKFEIGKLEQARKVCEAYRDELCAAQGIEPNAIVIDDLCSKLGSVTAGGKIAKAAIEAIEARVQTVENEKLKAQIEAERKAQAEKETADKIRAEEAEKAKQREIELARKAEADKAAALAKAEREKQEAVEAAKREAATVSPNLYQEAMKESQEMMRASIEKVKAEATYTPSVSEVLDIFPIAKGLIAELMEAPAPRTDGKKVLRIMARFETVVPEKITNEQVEAKLKLMMSNAGISSLKSIEIY